MTQGKLDYRLLAIDEGRARLSLIDTATSAFHWSMDLADYPLARDMQRLGGGRALVGYDRGFFEIDIASGTVLARCARWRDVTSATRLADGRTLVTGYNLDGSGGINVLTLGARGEVLHTARRDGDYVRLMRTTPEGTYLLCMNDHILETTPELEALQRFAAPGFEHAWKAERRANGSTLVAAGYGAFLALFGRDGRCIRSAASANELPPAVAPFFYASFEQLPDGGLLLANWQGHGPDNGAKGAQLLRLSPDLRLTGSWSAPEQISSLQGILLLPAP